MFRTLSDRTTTDRQVISRHCNDTPTRAGVHTFFLPNVFEGKRQPRILLLDDAHLSKGTLSDHPKEAEMIKIRYSYMISTRSGRRSPPSSLEWELASQALLRTLIAGSYLFPLRISHLGGCVARYPGNGCSEQLPTFHDGINRVQSRNTAGSAVCESRRRRYGNKREKSKTRQEGGQ